MMFSPIFQYLGIRLIGSIIRSLIIQNQIVSLWFFQVFTILSIFLARLVYYGIIPAIQRSIANRIHQKFIFHHSSDRRSTVKLMQNTIPNHLSIDFLSLDFLCIHGNIFRAIQVLRLMVLYVYFPTGHMICLFKQLNPLIHFSGQRNKLRNFIICYGTFIYILLHLIINLAGSLALIPLTGVPLPFLSYGGSYNMNIILMCFVLQRIAIENKINEEKRQIKLITNS